MHIQIYFTAFIVCCLGLVVLICCPNLTDLFIHLLMPLKLEDYTNKNFSMPINSVQLSSSVWCFNRLDGSKMCKFKNLFYLPNYKEYFFFYLTENSVVSGVKSTEEFKKISLSTVKNHPSLCMKLVFIKSWHYLQKKNIVSFDDDVFIMKRFKPDNIMHLIHDDILPLYLTYQELCNGNISMCVLKYQLIFSDGNDEGPYYEWYSHFSNKIPVILAKQGSVLCLTNSIIGLTQESIWFQYGFKSVQGPVINPLFNGLRIKGFVEFMKQRLRIDQRIDQTLPLYENDQSSIVFLSRKINRRILNESVVEEGMKESYRKVYDKNVHIFNLDLSTTSLKDIISLIHKSHLLIGMHGSGMILSLFLPEGSHIFELFPFGIEPAIVSPVKVMCSIQGVFYQYNAWKNTNESNTRTHPEYPPLHGGILHLPLSKQKEILNTKTIGPVPCCHNPAYLFRMFQDTVLDHSFYKTFEEIIRNKNETCDKFLNANKVESIVNTWYLPPPVFKLSCKCIKDTLVVTWKFPFYDDKTNVKFSVATSTGILKITTMLHVSIGVQDCQVQESNISVWVKTLYNDVESLDSYTQCLS